MIAALFRYTILKFFFAFLLVTFYLLLVASSAFAQTPASPSDLQPTTYNLQPNYLPSQSPHFASMAIYNFSHAMSCILIGQSPISPCLEYKMYRDAQGMIKSVPYLSQTNTNNGMLGLSLAMIGEVISTPPIRSSEFIADLGKQIGIKQAHAQVGGSGSGVLAPIFKLWLVSRNIAYIAMIIIFILVGLMVMFRQKLNPQTVVSVQLALPGLVIGLIMIAFSYFLASLISDMAFVGTNVVGYYFTLAQDPPIDPPVGLQNPISKGEDNVLTIFSRFTGIIGMDQIWNLLDSVWPFLDVQIPSKKLPAIIDQLPDFARVWDISPAKALTVIAAMTATQFILPYAGLQGGFLQAFGSGAAVAFAAINPQGLIAFTLSWVAMIALIYSMFKLLIKLVTNFLSIIFLTIASPFYFLAASIPGRQGLAATWMFNMLCNVLAFPAVYAVFYFAAFMLGSQYTDPLFAIKGGGSLANNSTFPLLGGLQPDFLRILLAFGALIASPSIPDIICRTVGKPGQLGALAAGAMGGAIASGQKYQGQMTQGGHGFAQNVGKIGSTTEYKIEKLDARGRPQYKVDPYRSHAGQWAKAGIWINQKLGRGDVVHEQEPVNPNNNSHS